MDTSNGKTLAPGRRERKKVVCYGFKEVRYINVLDNLFAYLDFLSLIFPQVAFVFNTRDIENVLKSGWWPERDQEEAIKIMKRCETLFLEYERAHSNAFLISYEDMINKSPKIRALFDFLGAEYSETAINIVIATPHSYPTNK